MNPVLPPHYAESVMIHLLSADGLEDLSLRIARFPERGSAHVWFHAAHRESTWSVVDETFQTDTRATDEVRHSKTLLAWKDAEFIEFRRDVHHGRLEGVVTAEFSVSPGRHVSVGPGEESVKLELSYRAGSEGDHPGIHRWETTGRVSGVIVIAGTPWRVDEQAKWHEQTGARPRFAPAFTYLNLQGDSLALLAIGFAERAQGYLECNGSIDPVVSFSIDPPGRDERRFEIILSDKRTVTGTSTRVQSWSVPIEGIRRPGSSVLAETSLGPMRGSLNDWIPEGP